MKKFKCEACGEVATGEPIISQLDNKTKMCQYCADLDVQYLLRGGSLDTCPTKSKEGK